MGAWYPVARGTQQPVTHQHLADGIWDATGDTSWAASRYNGPSDTSSTPPAPSWPSPPAPTPGRWPATRPTARWTELQARERRGLLPPL